jgi:flagellar hook-associated protein 1 FlgK
MLSFQNAFDAAARVMTTVDDMLNTLINKTGLVGIN